MGISRGGKNAQSVNEMLSVMEKEKSRDLSVHRGQSLYKKDVGAQHDEKLRELVALNIEELAQYATTEQVSLSDTSEVKKRSIIYLRACEESGTFPSSLGLARSLGYSDRALRYWRRKHPESKTAQWLEVFNDTCSDILGQAALKNHANVIMSIFLNKALYELRETSEVILSPKQDLDQPAYSVEEIKKRYMIEEKEGD